MDNQTKFLDKIINGREMGVFLLFYDLFGKKKIAWYEYHLPAPGCVDLNNPPSDTKTADWYKLPLSGLQGTELRPDSHQNAGTQS